MFPAQGCPSPYLLLLPINGVLSCSPLVSHGGVCGLSISVMDLILAAVLDLLHGVAVAEQPGMCR